MGAEAVESLHGPALAHDPRLTNACSPVVDLSRVGIPWHDGKTQRLQVVGVDLRPSLSLSLSRSSSGLCNDRELALCTAQQQAA